jgi:2-polyprenyl-6-methoxyphenol hydroxylase-like FAD-dependent oxidoreductase
MVSSSSPFPAVVEVLIAGAGPTGLALAAELRRRGVAATVVDRLPAGENTSRAAVVHARTLEVLEPLGVTSELLARGLRVPVFRVRDRDRVLLTIDFAGLPSPFPFTLMCPQDRTERVLLDRLEELGGHVDRPWEVVAFEVSTRDVSVELRGAETESRTLTTQWLVGCDGMHSRVRDGSGIAFEGARYEQGFVLADVRMDWPLGRDEVSLFFSPRGLVVVAPLPDDRFRIVATVDEAPQSPSADFVRAVLDERGPTESAARIHEVVWSSRFFVHHRVAESPRRGRVLLCGDAAHVHSPAGGQGMNTGIQDGVSLAAALAETLADDDETRLDEWARDRHRVATDVVALTDRMTRIATARSGVGRAARNAALAFVAHVPGVREALARTLAELDDR